MQDRPPAPDPDTTPDSATDSISTPETSAPRRVDLPTNSRRVDTPTTPQKSRTTTQDAAEPLVGPAVPPPLAAAPSPNASGIDRPWRWPLISLAGLVAVILVNWLAVWLPLNDRTTGEIANAHAVPFQPAGWAFLIWSLIYGLLLAFVIYSFLPAGRHSSRIQAIGPFFLIANIANIAWIIAWHWEQFFASLVAIVILLGSLAAIYAMLRTRDEHGRRGSLIQRFLVGGTFSIYLGWISIATLANLEVWMANGGWSGGPFGLNGWTIIFLIGGLLVASVFAFFGRDAAYPLVFAWGFAAIAQEQWGESALISILAGILALAALALVVMAILLEFDANRDPHAPPRSRPGRWRNRNTSSGDVLP